MQLPDRDAASHDWLTNSKTMDTDPESFGASLIFLFYLKSQLGHSMQEIIQKGGSTLELTYQNVTGQSGAITTFRNFIDPYFPVGSTPSLATDNPFPLLGAGQREVNIDPTTAANGSPYTVRSGEANVSPGILCPKKLYRYSVLSTPQILTCVATAKGFAEPVYNWRVNGTDVPGFGPISPPATVTMDNPDLPGLQLTKTVPVTIQCAITPATFSSTLVMTFSAVEHIDLVIEAFAHEKFASTDVTGEITWVTVDNERLQWDDQYYQDRAACEKHWRDLVKSYVRYDPFFSILRTLPDPPEEYARVFRQSEQLSLAIIRLHERLPREARQIEKGIEHATGINTVLLHDIGRMGRSTRNLHQSLESTE